MPPHFYCEIIEMAKARGVKTLLDTDGEALNHALEAKPTVITPNQHEAERLLSRAIITRGQSLEAVDEMQAMGPETVILSLGARGAIGSSPEGVFEALPPRIEALCPIGAGDALGAAFAWSMEKKKSFEEALRWGVATGTAAAAKLPGAIVSLPSPMRAPSTNKGTAAGAVKKGEKTGPSYFWRRLKKTFDSLSPSPPAAMKSARQRDHGRDRSNHQIVGILERPRHHFQHDGRYCREYEDQRATRGPDVRPIQLSGLLSIVFFVPDLLPVESRVLQNPAHIVHHRFQAAEIDVEVAPRSAGRLDRLGQMRLHAARAPRPSRFRLRQRRPKAELRKLARHRFKLLAVEQDAIHGARRTAA